MDRDGGGRLTVHRRPDQRHRERHSVRLLLVPALGLVLVELRRLAKVAHLGDKVVRHEHVVWLEVSMGNLHRLVKIVQ